MRNLLPLKEEIDSLKGFLDASDNVVAAYIFGSFGTEKQTPISDIDIAVLFGNKISLMEELNYAAEISSILHREDVDVINLNSAPVHIQHQVLYSGEKIYETDIDKVQDFVENVLEVYHDYEFILKKFRDDYQQGLAEEYLHG